MNKFILFFAINLLVHLPFMNLPPCGTHVWRQCNTLAMSRNFAEEGMNILEPKIDRRNASNGITGSHFPLFEWLLAACSKIFGFSDSLARFFSMTIFSFAMLAFYRLLVHFNLSDFLGKTGALLLLSIPEFYYHSINAMPDNLALCLTLFALVYWLKYQKDGGINSMLTAIVFSILGGLIKFQFLIIPLSALVFVPLKPKAILKYGLIWTGVGVVVYTWYSYALKLTQASNLKEYGLWIKPIASRQIWMTLKDNLFMDFPEVLLGWPLLIVLLIVLFKSIKSIKPTPVFWFAIFWLSMFLIFYMAAIERMKNHAYYFIPLLPVLVFIFMLLTNKLQLKRGFLLGLLAINFIWAFVRIIPSRWIYPKRQIPTEFSDPAMRKEFSAIIPPNTKCITGPDISGCIYFYFTHTKGYSFEHADELLTIKDNRLDIDNMRAAGMQYLIIKDGKRLLPLMKDLHLKRKIKTIGTFEIWEL